MPLNFKYVMAKKGSKAAVALKRLYSSKNAS
jgi:hypothetical protein